MKWPSQRSHNTQALQTLIPSQSGAGALGGSGAPREGAKFPENEGPIEVENTHL